MTAAAVVLGAVVAGPWLARASVRLASRDASARPSSGSRVRMRM